MLERSGKKTPAMENTRRAKVTTPSEREIVIERVFDAPRTLVFEAWTKAEHVTHWWDPSGAPLAICEIDLRPDGAFRWVNRAPDGGEGHSFSGIYREIVPPEKLIFGGPLGSATLVFTEHAKKTKLTMTIECATSKDRDAL